MSFHKTRIGKYGKNVIVNNSWGNGCYEHETLVVRTMYSFDQACCCEIKEQYSLIGNFLAMGCSKIFTFKSQHSFSRNYMKVSTFNDFIHPRWIIKLARSSPNFVSKSRKSAFTLKQSKLLSSAVRLITSGLASFEGFMFYSGREKHLNNLICMVFTTAM